MKIKKSLLKEIVKEVLEESPINEPVKLYKALGKKSKVFGKYYNFYGYKHVPFDLILKHLGLKLIDLKKLTKKNDGWIHIDLDIRDKTLGISANYR
jgi:hypothetical protein